MSVELRYNNFDLLRIAAASQVLIYHSVTVLEIDPPSWWSVIQAFPGVPIFFVISGFLISAAFERNPSLLTYARNRFLRIFPGLWCCLFLTVLVSAGFGFDFVNLSGAGWFVAQMVGLIYTPSFLEPFGYGSYNGSLWTIPVELQFYILLPIVYWFCRPVSAGVARLAFLWLLFLLVGFCFKEYMSAFSSGAEPLAAKVLQRTFVPHFFLFLTGVMMQRMALYRSRLVAGRFIYWVVAYLVAFYALPHTTEVIILLMLLLAVVTLSAAYSMPSLSERMLRGQDISYGVYIYHGIILNACVELGWIGDSVIILFVVAGTVFLAILSWIAVERPAIRRKRASIHSPPAVLGSEVSSRG